MKQQSQKTRFFPTRLALLVAAASCAAPAFADDQSDTTMSPALDRISISLGAFYSDTQTQIGATGRTGYLAGYNGHFSLEDDLGFRQHKAVPRAKFDFLIGDHQGFSFDYFSLDRTHGRTLDRDIDYNGTVFPASASVDGKLNFNFGSAAYRWWFGTGSDVFGLGIGAAYYGVRASIAGQAALGSESASAEVGTHETAWAPVLQLGWRHAFSHNLRVYADAYGVKKNGGNLNGHIWDAAVGMEWFPIENLGFGGEYSYTRIDLNQEHNAYTANLDMKLKGPSLFVKLRF